MLVNYAKTTFTTGLLAPYWLFALGALFVFVTIFLPKGIMGLLPQRAVTRQSQRRRPPPSAGRPAGGVSAMDAAIKHKPEVTQSLLYLNGVSVTFDGFRAINNLSLELAPGEMRAIIGPNGAGKTTMMDIITGKTRPDTGDVLFDQGTVDLTTKDESSIAQLGIGRKFQKPTVFENHTVEDNVLLSLKSDRSVLRNLMWNAGVEDAERISKILATIGLAAHRHRQAGSLSHGQKQWLEIGMLIAQDPKLLLVDEPVAGMTDAEIHDHGRPAAGRSPRTIPWWWSSTTWSSCAGSASRSPCCTKARCWPRARSTRSAPTSAWWRSIWGGSGDAGPSIRQRTTPYRGAWPREGRGGSSELRESTSPSPIRPIGLRNRESDVARTLGQVRTRAAESRPWSGSAVARPG